MKRKPYPSDQTDAQWALLEPWLPPPRPGGRPRKADLREVVNAIFYLNREGCSWRALPHDFPPWKTVYNYFDAWKRDGTWDQILTVLRWQVRSAAGRNPDPRVGCIDSQSVKTALGGQDVGTDGGKKIRGRKRHIVVDTMGFVLAIGKAPPNPFRAQEPGLDRSGEEAGAPRGSKGPNRVMNCLESLQDRATGSARPGFGVVLRSGSTAKTAACRLGSYRRSL